MSIRRSLAAVLSVGTLLVASACAGDNLDSSGSGNAADSTSPSTSAATSGSTDTSAGGPLTLAGQSFPEAALVASMYQQLLEKAGYDVTTKLVDSRDGYMADFPGGVDVVPEYVGGIVNFLNSQKNGDNATPFDAGDGEQLQQQGQALLDEAGITLLGQSAATDTNAFMVTQDYSDQNGATKLSDLQGVSVKLAAAPDCEGRLDCEGGLTDQYGIDVTDVLPLGYASDQTYQSVISGESELGETSTTDGTLASQGLVVLEDDKHIQPAQNLVPAVSTEFLSAHPDIAGILEPLMAALTTQNLTDLNSKIAVDRQKPEDVAKQFLTDNGLL
ncbi:MAG: osmoprotectant transport system substrate-binding protein [Nocardioidaceae bacterium]|jgi:osmoprotectant transport system substrate-binding protein|nr:osmoprotectant transport system substrate-binding protein [Nocardioidaceae bacterium]